MRSHEKNANGNHSEFLPDSQLEWLSPKRQTNAEAGAEKELSSTACRNVSRTAYRKNLEVPPTARNQSTAWSYSSVGTDPESVESAP